MRLTPCLLPLPHPRLPYKYVRNAVAGPSRPPHRHQSTTPRQSYLINNQTFPIDSHSNTPSSILSKLPRRLLSIPNHPLSIIKQIIETHLSSYTPFNPSSPIVTVTQNFDELGFPPDHPGRSLTDSYYLNKEYMLRTHTSAHEIEAYKAGLDRYTVAADVYRRDEIDSSHYPVFHQMEGAHVWPMDDLSQLPDHNAYLSQQLSNCPLVIEDTTAITSSNPYQAVHDAENARQMTQHLKHSLNGLIFKLFGGIAQENGEPLRIRWIEAFFPWTSPSFEVEIWWEGRWLELLGCGVVVQKTLETAGQPLKQGWAFGLGLERLAMVLFSIPDIRLFWSEDHRFLSQFQQGQIATFKPYSKYPACLRDMSFWLPQPREGKEGGEWHENDVFEVVRDVAGDLVETVELVDKFTHPKTGKSSRTYRLNYRSMDRSLSNEEVNVFQAEVQSRIVEEMGVEIR